MALDLVSKVSMCDSISYFILIEEKTKFAVREEIWIYFISAEIKLSTSSVTSHEFSQSNILRLLKQGTLSGEKEKKLGTFLSRQNKRVKK